MLKTLTELMKYGKTTLSRFEVRIEREGLTVTLRLVLPLAFLAYAVVLYLIRS